MMPAMPVFELTCTPAAAVARDEENLK